LLSGVATVSCADKALLRVGVDVPGNAIACLLAAGTASPYIDGVIDDLEDGFGIREADAHRGSRAVANRCAGRCCNARCNEKLFRAAAANVLWLVSKNCAGIWAIVLVGKVVVLVGVCFLRRGGTVRSREEEKWKCTMSVPAKPKLVIVKQRLLV
jgi:hypothetical protein